MQKQSKNATVDGSEILHQLRLVVYPIIYGVLAPSQVVIAGFLNHQQYLWKLDFACGVRWTKSRPKHSEKRSNASDVGGFHSSFKNTTKRRHKTHPLPGGLNLCLIVIE